MSAWCLKELLLSESPVWSDGCQNPEGGLGAPSPRFHFDRCIRYSKCPLFLYSWLSYSTVYPPNRQKCQSVLPLWPSEQSYQGMNPPSTPGRTFIEGYTACWAKVAPQKNFHLHFFIKCLINKNRPTSTISNITDTTWNHRLLEYILGPCSFLRKNTILTYPLFGLKGVIPPVSAIAHSGVAAK